MEKQKSVQEVIVELSSQVALARENKQTWVAEQLLKKIARIEKRAKKA